MTHLKITGMTCDSCAVHVKEALEKVPGVQSAVVSYAKGAAQLDLDPGTASDALTAVVAGLGYRATLADTSSTDNRTGLHDKVRGWMGTADKGSDGERQLTFDEVVVRVRGDFALEFHIDTEEANAAGLKNGAQVRLLG